MTVGWYWRLVTVLVSAAFWSRADAAAAVRRLEDSVSFLAYPDAAGQHVGVAAIAVNPRDPSVALTSSPDGEVALWDLTSLSLYWRQKVGQWRTGLSFSHQGGLVAAGGDQKVYLLRLSDGAVVQTFVPLTAEGVSSINFQSPIQLAFNADDSELIVGYADRIFRFDTATAQLIHRYGDSPFDYFWGVDDTELSADERFLFEADERKFRVFSTTSHEMVRSFAFADVPHFDAVEIDGVAPHIRVTSDGAYTVYALDHFVYVIDNGVPAVIRKVFAAAAKITDVAFTIDQCCFITAAADGTSRFYDIATGGEITRLDDTGPSSDRQWFMSIAAPERSGFILTGDAAGSVRIWKP